MALDYRCVVFLVLVSFGAGLFFSSKNNTATTDDFDYLTAPPQFVWQNIIPLFKRAQTFTKELDPPFFQVLSEVSAAQLPPLLAALCRKDIPDLLLDGPHTVSWIAEKTKTDPNILYRTLRRVSQVGYFRELPPLTASVTNLVEHRFENTAKSHSLARNRPNPSARWMLLHQTYDINPVLSKFEEVLEKGESHHLFNKVWGLKGDMWEYFTADPEKGMIFNKAMEHLDGVGGIAPVVDFDWASRCDVVIDTGGGKGRYLYNILANTNVPKGILLDLEHPISEAKKEWPLLYSKEVNEKVSFKAGSFFNAEDIPKSDGVKRHCYVLRVVIHDWSDEDSVKILSNIAKASSSKDLLVITEALPADIDPEPAYGWMDMVMSLFRGKERTVFQFNQLLEKSGFQSFFEVHPTRSMFKIALAKKK